MSLLLYTGQILDVENERERGVVLGLKSGYHPLKNILFPADYETLLLEDGFIAAGTDNWELGHQEALKQRQEIVAVIGKYDTDRPFGKQKNNIWVYSQHNEIVKPCFKIKHEKESETYLQIPSAPRSEQTLAQALGRRHPVGKTLPLENLLRALGY